ncbi:hypothetical protein [uncultured Microbacterium sp.]|uniref:hypothetical protein n=1 Tax=uncultured Microbacterium sp. TaxID=191216 RepID=UPI0025D209BA|nr:hypothetical protein [uncultured Microbacterium sp.]
MRLDVLKSRELLATIYAIRSLDKTIQKMIRQETKSIAAPEWTKALTKRANTALEQQVIVNTAVVSVSNQNVRAQSANKGRPLSGGLNPKTDYPAVEWGADDDTQVYERRSRKGGMHSVKRHTARQFKRRSSGYVWGPTVQEMIPRLARLWVQTTVRTIANAIDGKQE